MENTYDINQLALMSGFTTRTLRTYLSQGILNGTKENGIWRFSEEEVDRFFSDPYVKEGLRIKRNNLVYDFLGQRHTKEKRTCVVLDVPAGLVEGNKISALFCKEMEAAQDVVFNYIYEEGACRIILSGKEEEVMRLLEAYRKLS
ncbi:MAG: MerR family transcriptional regulator [Erysipelotrichaceae bacterium]|nr:MerR family transcriptional regulator [Erysipelotrichaceae bacterium]